MTERRKTPPKQAPTRPAQTALITPGALRSALGAATRCYRGGLHMRSFLESPVGQRLVTHDPRDFIQRVANLCRALRMYNEQVDQAFRGGVYEFIERANAGLVPCPRWLSHSFTTAHWAAAYWGRWWHDQMTRTVESSALSDERKCFILADGQYTQDVWSEEEADAALTLEYGNALRMLSAGTADDPLNDLITTDVAVREYATTSKTIQRYIASGKLKDHRPPGQTNAKHMLSRAELGRYFVRRR